MAQKVSSRSLRSQQYHGTDLALYSEHAYADLWQQACVLANQGQMFGQQNQTYKKRRKATKRRPKKYRLPGFLLARWALAYRTNALQLSPIFMKFDEQSLAHKYNPIKAVYKRNAGVRSLGRRHSIEGPVLCVRLIFQIRQFIQSKKSSFCSLLCRSDQN